MRSPAVSWRGCLASSDQDVGVRVNVYDRSKGELTLERLSALSPEDTSSAVFRHVSLRPNSNSSDWDFRIGRSKNSGGKAEEAQLPDGGDVAAEQLQPT